MCKILNDVDEVIKNKSERFYFFSVERINWINWIDLITPCCCLASCSKGAPGLVLEAKAFTGFGMCGIFPKMWENKACLSSKADVGGGDKWKPSGSDSHWRACAPNTNQRAYLLSVGESKLGCVVQSNIGFHMFGFYCSEIGTSKNCNDLVTFSRDNTVKQYYFWQNSMLSHAWNKWTEQNNFFAGKSCLLEVHLIYWAAGKLSAVQHEAKKQEWREQWKKDGV